MNKQETPVWLVEHPTYRYQEDVKKLARKAGARIVDPAFASEADREQALPADKAPKLNLKPEFAPKKAADKKEA